MNKDDAFLKKLLATFKVEANEHVTALTSGLLELETALSHERRAAVIEAVFREAHSLKGAARSVNLTDIEAFCQALESVFAALKRREIEPARQLLDLLHKTINLLNELLASAGAEVPPSDKQRVRNAVAELNNAAKGCAQSAATPDRAIVQVPSAAGEAAHPAASGIAAAPSDSMRISKSKLDTILLQGEEFLGLQQAIAHQAEEVRKFSEGLAAFRKEWSKIQPELRSFRKAGDAGTMTTGSAACANGKKLIDFLDAQEDRIAKLQHSFSLIEKAAGQDQRTISVMVGGLIDNLKTISMLPFSSLLDIIAKTVRDLSHDQDKEVVFSAAGGDIEIDKRILDEMREPLIHLIRNCIDHGIEKPAERTANRKPAAGTVTVTITHREGKAVEVVISDDGRGVDTARILDAAVKTGMLSRGEADDLEEQQILQLMFRSGVTTSPIITDLSGRGLGLAIVRERVEKLGGILSCESAPGKGTAFRILLPLSLATFRGVLVRVDDRSFVLPTVGLDRMLRLKQEEIKTIENRETVLLEGQTVPFVLLQDVLELPRKAKASSSGLVHAAVLGADKHRIAFGVDEVFNEQEVLVKDLGRQLVRVRNVAAATVLGTGKVVLILNVSDLLKSAIRVSSSVRTMPVAEQPEGKKPVLIVEDSITSRTLLKNILEASGYEVQTAVDGADALAALKTGEFGLVVSDVDMPRMNGFELTGRIRGDKQLAELPVILVTALESREDRERGIDVGANAYIVKSSFDKSNLLEAIRRLI